MILRTCLVNQVLPLLFCVQNTDSYIRIIGLKQRLLSTPHIHHIISNLSHVNDEAHSLVFHRPSSAIHNDTIKDVN